MSVGGWSIGTFKDPSVQSCDELAYSKRERSILLFFCRQRHHRLPRVLDDDGPENEGHRQRGGDQRGLQSLRQGKLARWCSSKLVRF